MDHGETKRAHWRWSLATKLAAAWAISLGIAVGVSSWVTHREAGHRLLDGLRQGMDQDAGEIRLRLETWSRAFQEDARSCSQSPLVFEFLEKRGSADEARWRVLLEDEFRSVFAGKQAYFQMRLLAADGPGEGDELVRLDRKSGGLIVTEQGRLQSKADRGYFRDAVAMAAGEIYLSEIDLNRDFGEISYPHIPTMRAAVKVGGGARGAAILIINADMREVFDEVRKLASPDTEVRLLDSVDNYLMHPQDSACFAADLGTGLLPAEEFPELVRGVESESGWLRGDDRAGALVLAAHIDLLKPGARSVTALLTLREAAWFPELMRSKRRAIWAAGLAALIGAAVALLLSLPFTARLRQLSSALRQYDASEVPEGLPEPGKDEVGMAIERFREMAVKVREQIEKLRASRHEAEEANAAKEAFLAVMSHEIRTPMNAVAGLIRALEANSPPAHQAPILASLRTSSTNLMTLLNTALDYTRLREGAIEYSSESFDAARLVREVGQAFKPGAMAKQLEMRLDLPDGLLVRGDAVRFRQIVNNLVGNAVKFTQSGSVEISLRHDGEQLVCQVADTGPGIRSEDRARLFNPFTSLASDGRATETGAGLGLAVSKQLVDQQGGELKLESEFGSGALFSVRLPYPCASGSLDVPEATRSRARRLPDGLRILYVEDVASNQQVMALTLQGSNCELICADTGADALGRLREERFDLALLDLQLPDMSGIALAKRIRDSHPQLPLVAVTAQASEQAAQNCREAGILAVVLKPFTAEALIGAIATACGSGMAEKLDALHPGDPQRSRALAATMAEEFRAAAGELEKLYSESDRERSREHLLRVRHKLKTAVATFQLDEIGALLDQLVAADQPDPRGVLEAAAMLTEAGAELDGRAAVPTRAC